MICRFDEAVLKSADSRIMMDQLVTSTMETAPEAVPDGAARVGADLRDVRERLGWRLADMAWQLKIRLPYLEAIEQGELSALPGPAYQTGFVRTYAQALGLDGEEILRRFRAEGTGIVQPAPLRFPAPVPDRAVPTGALVMVGVVLLLAGYGLWYRHTAAQVKLAAAIPAVPADLAALAPPPAPGQAPATAPTTPAVTPLATPQASPLAANAPAGAQASLPAPATTTPAPAATPAATPPTAAASTATTTDTDTASPPAIANGKIIQASGDDWVQVTDPKGNIIYSHTMHAGDSWPVPDLPGLMMTAGNAGATRIDDNGVTGAPLGAAGAVLHDYGLTAPAAAPPTPTAATAPALATAPANTN